MALATLTQLQQHLRLPVGVASPPSAAEADLQLKLDQAEAIVLDYIRRADNAATILTWNAAGSPSVPVPPSVQAAVLVQAGELYRFRGDDLETVPRETSGDLSPTVKALLYRWRDPVLA